MQSHLRRPARWLVLLAILALAGGTVGCAASAPCAAGSPLGLGAHVHLIHLTGMAGWTPWDTDFLRGLSDAGLGPHLEVDDWTGPHWLIGAYLAREHNRAEARYLATQIADKLRAEPDAQIILTAWSAGCAVAIWTLEDLPEGAQVQSVLLVQPAVDPRHDMARALRHVRGHCLATRSAGDCVILGLGNILVGTADTGAHAPAAGCAGFQPPPADPGDEYRKLVTIPYQSGWIRYGDFGGHIGPMHRDFARDILAPCLLDDLQPAHPIAGPTSRSASDRPRPPQ